MNEKKLIGVEELALYLDSSVAFIRKLILTRQIPYIKIGGRVKFDLVEVNQWIDERRQEERKNVLFI